MSRSKIICASTYALLNDNKITSITSSGFETQCVEIDKEFSTNITEPLAFSFTGIPTGIAAETTLVQQFFTFILTVKKVEYIFISRIIFATQQSIDLFARVLEVHRDSLRFVEIIEVHNSFGDFGSVCNAFCSLHKLQRALWRCHHMTDNAMESNIIRLNIGMYAKKFEQFVKVLYNNPLVEHINISTQKKYQFHFQKRFEYAQQLLDKNTLRRCFAKFSLPFVRSGLHDTNICRIFTFKILNELLKDEKNHELYDENLFIKSLFPGEFQIWQKQYLKTVTNFKLSKTEYFCRTCQYPLCREENPVRCKCGRACYCSKVCQKKKKKLFESGEKIQPRCCQEQIQYNFTYCSDCLLQEYHICKNPNSLNNLKVVCNSCFFGPCPRGCGKIFCKEDWLHKGKEHRVIHKCFNPSCSNIFYLTCSLKDSVNGAKKSVLLCFDCESNYKEPT